MTAEADRFIRRFIDVVLRHRAPFDAHLRKSRANAKQLQAIVATTAGLSKLMNRQLAFSPEDLSEFLGTVERRLRKTIRLDRPAGAPATN